MPWVKTDDAAPQHAKFFRSGLLAYGFWHACLSYCNRWLTDGHIPTRELPLIFPGATPGQIEECVEALVRERVLEVHDEGYAMHDYLQYQPSRKETLRLRKDRKTAARKGGVRSGKNRQALASTKREANREVPSRPVPTRPDPSHKEELTALSGTPDGVSLNGKPSEYREQAREVLAFLNAKTGRSYRPVDTNLRLIEARLRAGATVENCRGVIVRKARAWLTDPKMSEYLRPATLFNALRFEQYLGEREAVDAR